MSTLTVELPLTQEAEEEHWPCCASGCNRRATHVVSFKGQHGHVHDCGPCTAALLEFCDVEYCAPLPCPYPRDQHNATWTDQPVPLEEDECPPSDG